MLTNTKVQFQLVINIIELSRRDDLWSILYCLIYLLNGELPWKYNPNVDLNINLKKIGELKLNCKAADLCSGRASKKICLNIYQNSNFVTICRDDK